MKAKHGVFNALYNKSSAKNIFILIWEIGFSLLFYN